MVNCHLLRRWITRTSAGSTMTRANGEVVSQSSPAPSPTNDRNTVGPSALQTTLQELVSSVPAGLVPTVISLSAVTKRIEASSQTSANVQSLQELAALLAVITEVAQKNKNKGHTFFKDLDRELQSLTENLEVAYSQGRLNEFFNAAHNTSSYMDLVQLMADSVLVTADDFLKSIRGVECAEQVCVGGVGGTGGTARIGGEGGEGGGPRLDLDPSERCRIANISGGTGGTGGVGVEVGGKGGTGKGPVIRASRTR
ncbi:hypothetical protein DFH08DRAFT_817255 [Mycena albidolilacea]|uniref:Uncharacterized protein n=1 Tax=Mycena albidolilacea TaxID=1033008 RepID=A0AAD6ZIX4_9AGAR|nr:hypothetical protein DFH08DRAFT_817255 [Mycena albidolilacea]